MDLGPEPERDPRESVVPMINVGFLLLVFFLLVAAFPPPEPFPVEPPEAEGDASPDGEIVLWLAADGRIAHGGHTGDAALAAAAADAAAAERAVILRADRASDGAELARILGALAAGGAGTVEIVTAGP